MIQSIRLDLFYYIDTLHKGYAKVTINNQYESERFKAAPERKEPRLQVMHPKTV